MLNPMRRLLKGIWRTVRSATAPTAWVPAIRPASSQQTYREPGRGAGPPISTAGRPIKTVTHFTCRWSVSLPSDASLTALPPYRPSKPNLRSDSSNRSVNSFRRCTQLSRMSVYWNTHSNNTSSTSKRYYTSKHRLCLWHMEKINPAVTLHTSYRGCVFSPRVPLPTIPTIICTDQLVRVLHRGVRG